MSLEESASGITPKNVLIPPIRIDVPKGVKIGLIYIYIYIYIYIERESCATHYCLTLCTNSFKTISALIRLVMHTLVLLYELVVILLASSRMH